MRAGCSILLFCLLVLSIFFPFQEAIAKDKIEWLFEVHGLQKSHSFNRPQGMFLDSSQKKIYIADTGNRKVAIFSLSGEALGIFHAEHPFAAPVCIFTDPEGKIYVSCREKESLEVFDAKGKFLYPVPSADFLKKHAFSAGRFVLGPAGRIYAINREADEIWVFEPNGSLAFRFGGRGSEEGKFQFITDICFHGEKIYLTDAQGIPVQVFTTEGKYLYSFGKHGQREEDFSFPQAVCVDRSQRIWVVDAFRHRVQVFDQQGKLQFGFGSYGTEAGKFCFPIDLDFDNQDRIYILEKSSNRFQVFQKISDSSHEIEGTKGQGEKKRMQGEKKKM
ncbi:MAG: 6-bladed beta-propeller [bacterium]